MSIVHHTNRDIEKLARKLNEMKAKIRSIERSLIKTQGGGTAVSDTRGVTESAIVLDDITDLAAIAGDRLKLTGTRLDVEITPIEIIGSPTYITLEDLINVLLSAGAVTGGIISDAGGETINVAAGTGFIRNDDTSIAPLLSFDWVEETGLAIPTNTSRHIGIEYNGGSPQVVLKEDDSDFNEHDNWHLGDVVNAGGTLHIQNIPHNVGNLGGHTIERLVQTEDPQRGFGLILGESGDANRYITVTVGSIWNRLTESAIAAFDSSGADRFDIYHRDGGTGFTKVSNQQAWDMDSYDDGNIATLGANKYAVMWFYMEFDGEVVAQYGRAQYVTQFQAEEEEVPSTAPDRIVEHSMLIGRLIFKKDTTPALAVETVFVTMFATNGVTSHPELANISTDDHHTKFTTEEAIAAVEGNANEFSEITTFNAAAIMGGGANVLKDVNNSTLFISGGDVTNAGANIALYGGAHASKANDFQFRASGSNRLTFDASATLWTLIGTLDMLAGSLIMRGAGSDDEALQLPYLTQAPATLANGMMWMEADGTHIYRDGVEKILAEL